MIKKGNPKKIAFSKPNYSKELDRKPPSRRKFK